MIGSSSLDDVGGGAAPDRPRMQTEARRFVSSRDPAAVDSCWSHVGDAKCEATVGLIQKFITMMKGFCAGLLLDEYTASNSFRWKL